MATTKLFDWKRDGRLNWKEGEGLVTPLLEERFRAGILRLRKAVLKAAALPIVHSAPSSTKEGGTP